MGERAVGHGVNTLGKRKGSKKGLCSENTFRFGEHGEHVVFESRAVESKEGAAEENKKAGPLQRQEETLIS